MKSGFVLPLASACDGNYTLALVFNG